MCVLCSCYQNKNLTLYIWCSHLFDVCMQWKYYVHNVCWSVYIGCGIYTGGWSVFWCNVCIWHDVLVNWSNLSGMQSFFCQVLDSEVSYKQSISEANGLLQQLTAHCEVASKQLKEVLNGASGSLKKVSFSANWLQTNSCEKRMQTCWNWLFCGSRHRKQTIWSQIWSCVFIAGLSSKWVDNMTRQSDCVEL